MSSRVFSSWAPLGCILLYCHKEHFGLSPTILVLVLGNHNEHKQDWLVEPPETSYVNFSSILICGTLLVFILPSTFNWADNLACMTEPCISGRMNQKE